MQIALVGLAAATAIVHADSANETARSRLIQLRGSSRAGPFYGPPREASTVMPQPDFCLRQDRKPACELPPCCCWSSFSTLADSYERAAAQKCLNPPADFTYVPDPGLIHDDGHLATLKRIGVPELVGRRLCCLVALEDPEMPAQSDLHLPPPHVLPVPPGPGQEPVRPTGDEIHSTKEKMYEKLKKKILGELPLAPTAEPGEPPLETPGIPPGQPPLEAPTVNPMSSSAPGPAPGGAMGPSPSPAKAPFGIPPTTPTPSPPSLLPGEEYETAQMEKVAREHLKTAFSISEAAKALNESVYALQGVKAIVQASPELSNKPARVAELRRAVNAWATTRWDNLAKFRVAANIDAPS